MKQSEKNKSEQYTVYVYEGVAVVYTVSAVDKKEAFLKARSEYKRDLTNFQGKVVYGEFDNSSKYIVCRTANFDNYDYSDDDQMEVNYDGDFIQDESWHVNSADALAEISRSLKVDVSK